VLPRILELATEVGDVVVDCGFSLEEDELGLGRAAGRNQLTLDALAAADEVVVVGAADPVGLSRLARALMELRERVAPSRVRVVVNRMRDSLGWREQEVLGMVEGYAAPVGIHLLPGGDRRQPGAPRPRPRRGRRLPGACSAAEEQVEPTRGVADHHEQQGCLSGHPVTCWQHS
jgi:hypothetical protein